MFLFPIIQHGLNTEFIQYGDYFYLISRTINSFTDAYSNPTVVQAFRQMNFSYHCREGVTILQMKIIIWTIEICRHNCNIIGTILQIKAFTHFQSYFFAIAYGSLVYSNVDEQCIFLHWLFGISNINTCTT